MVDERGRYCDREQAVFALPEDFRWPPSALPAGSAIEEFAPVQKMFRIRKMLWVVSQQ